VTEMNANDQVEKIGPSVRLTRFILGIFVPDYEETEKHSVRTAYGYLEGWASILLNIALFAVKLIFGLLFNSISLIADSFHTLADVVTSVIVVIGFFISRQPADREHPHGHGRFENIATLVIAILLVIIGVEFFRTSLNRFIKPQVVGGTITVALVILASALLKEWLARFAIYLGNKIKASVLLADAWHHRTDAIASALVSVAIGAAILGYFKVDSVFGMLVSALIVYTGYILGRTAVSFLMGEAPSEELVDKISRIALSIKGVKNTHKVTVHDYGTHKAVSLHVHVDKNLTVDESHHIAMQVKDRISALLQGTTAEVHIEPEERS
jgi:cation diffusion facilitator family transporter